MGGFTNDLIVVRCWLLIYQLIFFSCLVKKTAAPKILGILDIRYKSKINQIK